MMLESCMFTCPVCKKPYCGLIHKCPHCQYELRPASKISDEKWELVQKIIRPNIPPTYEDIGIDLASGEDYTAEAGIIKDKNGNFKIVEMSIVPKYGK